MNEEPRTPLEPPIPILARALAGRPPGAEGPDRPAIHRREAKREPGCDVPEPGGGRVLIVDDDPMVRGFLERIESDRGEHFDPAIIDTFLAHQESFARIRGELAAPAH